MAAFTELREINPRYVGKSRLRSEGQEDLLELGQLLLYDVPAFLLLAQVFHEAWHFPVLLVVLAAFAHYFCSVFFPIFEDTRIFLENPLINLEFRLFNN